MQEHHEEVQKKRRQKPVVESSRTGQGFSENRREGGCGIAPYLVIIPQEGIGGGPVKKGEDTMRKQKCKLLGSDLTGK